MRCCPEYVMQRKGERKRKVRVLVVDDRPGSRNGLTALLGTCAVMEVVGEAGDGIEAVRLSGQLGPDVVLMDAKMPRMDGVEAMRRMKSDRPDIPVVILTMYPTLADQARKSGADAVLMKGCPAQKLLDTIWLVTER
jgi:DNA-binding NarL/FixJ family response regulator